MKFSNWLEGGKANRSLLVGGIIFGMLFPYNIFVVPRYPVLDGLFLDALAAVVAAGVAWWVVFRGPGRSRERVHQTDDARPDVDDRGDA